MALPDTIRAELFRTPEIQTIRALARASAGFFHSPATALGATSISMSQETLGTLLPPTAVAAREILASFGEAADSRAGAIAVRAYFADVARHADVCTSKAGLELRLSYSASHARHLNSRQTVAQHGSH